MAGIDEDTLGTKGEFGMRDDDRPSDTAYRVDRRPTTLVWVLLLGFLVAGGLVFQMTHDRETSHGADPAPAGQAVTR